MATMISSPSAFWGGGDERWEGGAFSFPVKGVAAAPLTVQPSGLIQSVRKNFNASSMSAGIGATNFTFFPVRG